MTATLLRNTLTSLHEHAREFAAVLQEELQHLSRLPTPGDWSLQDRKLVVMRELENGHRQLQQALQANGLGFLQGAALHQGMARCVGQDGLRLWQDTLQLLADCQRSNQIIGSRLARQQTVMRQSLDLLLGGTDQAMTYGRQGARRHMPRHASFGVA
ncbi:flagellar export chaperone FlgN [Perlucidibaca piscinae]|uniref:flagellar export chaperone FlgN n=1 Tax=Perlucidibaca piscinae TaxID=392589 RepID=UPI0003B42515|nr:flagellar export chaperone FlgN [Perlucidibaca piscinae]